MTLLVESLWMEDMIDITFLESAKIVWSVLESS